MATTMTQMRPRGELSRELLTATSDNVVVEVVRGHPGVQYDALSVDRGRPRAQQEGHRRSHFIRLHSLFPQCRLFGEQETVDVSRDAGRSRGL